MCACVQGVEPREWVGKPSTWSHVTMGRVVLGKPLEPCPVRDSAPPAIVCSRVVFCALTFVPLGKQPWVLILL